MKGTLQGDFSRLPFDRKKRYSAVRMQQGRVQLDSDWNEQADIFSERIRAGTADLIGPSGAPAGDAGFELIPEIRCLELGVEQHHLLIGGAEGFLRPDFPPLPGHQPGLTAELRFLPRTEGHLFSCWIQREQESRFRPVCSLRIDNRRLIFERPGQAELATGPREELIGRFHDVAASWGPEGVAIWLDGAPVAEDRVGIRIPAGRLLFLVGARQPPFLAGLFEEVRLWNVRRTHDALAGQGPDREGGEAGDAGLLGHWRFDVEGDRPTIVPDLGPHGLDAVIRGSDAPPRWLPGELRIGAGRFYADGVLCENPEDVPFTGQPDTPGALLPQPRGREEEHHLLYLDVWERSISAIEDPGIREVALGGPDTTTRGRIVPQVKVLRLEVESGRESERPSPAEIDRQWPQLIAPEQERGKLRAQRRQLATQRLENLLYRVEVHEGGDGRTATVKSVDAATGRIVLEHWDHGWRPGQGVELFPFGAAPQDGPRRLARVTAVEPERHTLVVSGSLGPALGSTDLRVRRIATFKWSRNNASVVFPVGKLDSGTGVVTLLPSARGTQGLEKGAWVELVDDRIALSGEATPLLRIEGVDTLRHQVTLSPHPQDFGTDPDRHPFLRVWDQNGDVTAWGVLPALGGDWQELEGGIQVRFQYDAPYRTGDYWWMPSRTSSQDVDWPRDSQGTPELLPPHGPEHRFSPLALLTYEPKGFRLLDLRHTFHPWASGVVSKAGDWMDGDLDVRADARIRGDLTVEGSGTFDEVWGPLRSRDAVDTPQIVDRSVTPEKLALTVGTVPAGTAILGLGGPGAAAPEGYEATGWSTILFSESPRWKDRRQLPGGPPGPLVSAAVGGRIYVLLESGAFWEYDPRTDLWVRRRDVPVSGRGCAIAALHGKVYVAGGIDAAGHCSSRLFEYDPGRDDWESRADLQTGRSSFGLVACRGRLHALGGLRDSASGRCVTARHEAWNPSSDTWSSQRPLPRRVCAMGAAATDDRISIVGGETRVFQGRWGGGFTDDHHQYHPSADRWLPTRAPLPEPRRHARLVEIYGKLFSVGGEGAIGWLGDFDCYEPTVDGWVAQPALHEPIELPGVASLDGTVYVTGALRNGGALMEECRVAARLRVLLREG